MPSPFTTRQHGFTVLPRLAHSVRGGGDGAPIAPVTDKCGTGWSNVLPIPETPGTGPWVTVDGSDRSDGSATILTTLGGIRPEPVALSDDGAPHDLAEHVSQPVTDRVC